MNVLLEYVNELLPVVKKVTSFFHFIPYKPYYACKKKILMYELKELQFLEVRTKGENGSFPLLE